MGLVYNLIPPSAYTLTTSTTGWSITSGTGTLSAGRDVARFDDAGTLRITPSAGSVTASISGLQVSSVDAGFRLRASAWVYATAARTVTMSASRVAPSSESTSTTKLIPANEWTLVTLDGPLTVADQTNTTALTLTTNGDTYFAWPTLTLPDIGLDSVFATEAWIRLPDYLRTADEAQTEPRLPLFRFMEVLFSEAETLMNTWIASRYLPPDDYYPFDANSLSQLVHPQVSPLDRLNWLAQFVGTAVTGNTNAFTSWADLNAVMSTWSQWATVPDTNPGTGDADGLAEWFEIESLKPVTSGVNDFMRWQVAAGAFGMHGGTNGAIKATVQQFLTGTRTVGVEPLADGDPWKVRVITLTAETPDVTAAGQVSGTLESVLQRTAPVGVQLVHESRSSIPSPL